MPYDPEFYVGYLPAAPPGVARVRRRAVTGLLLLAVCVGAGLSAAQREFSDGFFDFFQTRVSEGVVAERPYPVLMQNGGAELLVGGGKFGAASEIAGFDGRTVRLEGKSIRLGSQEMLEVAPGSVAAVDGPTESSAVPAADLGAFTLEGEIVDSKCYLGVMNPGRGKVHKGCAVRCISGGVPPGFLVKDESGTPTLFLLTDSDGRALRESVLPLVGRALRLNGRLERSNGLLYFRADLSKAALL